MIVLCYFALVTNQGYREVLEVKGIIVKEINDDLYVDFTKFIKANPRFEGYTFVQKLNNNDCVYK